MVLYFQLLKIKRVKLDAVSCKLFPYWIDHENDTDHGSVTRWTKEKNKRKKSDKVKMWLIYSLSNKKVF